MSDDSRRSDSARDARFHVLAPGRIRKRVLFATSRRRRNCCSGVQPIRRLGADFGMALVD